MDIEKVIKEFDEKFSKPHYTNDLKDWLRKKLVEAKKETIEDFDIEFGNNKVIKEYCERKLKELGE